MSRKMIKTVITTMLAVVMMSATVLAGTHTYKYSGSISVAAGFQAWGSADMTFSSKTTHNMKVDFQKTYAKGTATVGISKNVLWYSSMVASKDLSITTATTGVQYSVALGSVTKGTRHYVFGSDSTASFLLSGFSDTWTD